MPDVKLSQLAAASAASVAAGAGLWTMAGHILGLRMEYVGPSSIRVSSGSAWIPSLQRAIEVPDALTLSSLSLTASTWYHVYLYFSGSTPMIEAVTPAPAAPYSGTARGKTGDPSRRYIGSFRTDTAGAILRFLMTGDSVAYADPNSNPGGVFRVLANKTTAAEQAVSLANVVPVTATGVTIRQLFTRSLLDNASNVGFVSGSYWNNVGGGQAGFLILPLAQPAIYAKLNQDITDGNGGLYIDVQGYQVGR